MFAIRLFCHAPSPNRTSIEMEMNFSKQSLAHKVTAVFRHLPALTSPFMNIIMAFQMKSKHSQSLESPIVIFEIYILIVTVPQNLLTQLEFGWKLCTGQSIRPWTQVCQTGFQDCISTFQLNVFVFFYHDCLEGIFKLLNAGIGKVLVLFFHLHVPVLVVCRHYASPGFHIYAEDSMAFVKINKYIVPSEDLAQ